MSFFRVRQPNGKVVEISSLPGKKGADGKDGKSAYELAVAKGFEGDLDEWLASLKGADGDITTKVYEHIATITVTPDEDGSLPQYVTFSADSEGNAFELTDFYVHAHAGQTDGATSTLYMSVNGNTVLGNASVGFQSASLRSSTVAFRHDESDGFLTILATESMLANGVWNSQSNVKKQVAIPPSDAEPFSPVTKVGLYTLLGTNKTWVEGSTFELWGVRVGSEGSGTVGGNGGADGKSAYELAVEEGFEGDLDEWLASLKGETGATGKSAYQYAVDGGYEGTEEEFSKMLAGDALPEYWEAYLPDKIAAIKALQDEGGKDCFSFVVMTDMHYEQNLGKRAPLLAKRILDECGIKYALVLGDSGTRNGILHDLDYIDDEWDNIEDMLAPVRDRLLITDGNHDGSYGATDGDGDGVIDDVHGSGNSAFNFTPQKKYNRIKRVVSTMDGVVFDESGCGYYADDKNAKVRYIVLSTHNNKYEQNEDGSSKYSNMNNFRYGQSQFDMVVNALSTLEEGWSVLVASHVPLDRSGELLHWGATEMEDNRLVSGEVECWVMADVLNAFVNKTAYAGSFEGTQGAVANYTNLVDKASDDWLAGYRTSSSGLSEESGYDVTNFLGDGVTTVGDMTIYYKNATMSAQRLFFYNANKELVYACYPTTFTDAEGFDDTATEGRLFIDKNKSETLYKTAVYVRLCLVSGDTAPIITLDEPIEASGDAYDAVSVDVDFTEAKGTLIGYFGGHVHKDGAWDNTYTWDDRLKQCDFWTITTRCDSKNENDDSISKRVAGTITEQSFDVFTVNKATRTIHATKIGAGTDREIRY